MEVTNLLSDPIEIHCKRVTDVKHIGWRGGGSHPTRIVRQHLYGPAVTALVFVDVGVPNWSMIGIELRGVAGVGLVVALCRI